MAKADFGIPIIDMANLIAGSGGQQDVAWQLGEACREAGFFYIVGHGVSPELEQRLHDLSRQFFALDVERKLQIRMERGGRAWRGYFAVGDELTSGRPDQKEGLYFGSELEDSHPRVVAGIPLHGRNLFPDIARFRETVLEYLDAMTQLGHALMRGVAISLDLPDDFFAQLYTNEPLVLFRIFHYPPLEAPSDGESWGVGEHTDYGFLTILRQDTVGGLQIKTKADWIDAPPIPGAFVCNIGDMLDRCTGGLYRSTPHRVRNRSASGRLSFPFFFDPGFDPGFDAEVAPIKGIATASVEPNRWDGQDLRKLDGTYGDYILSKVAKVFPFLADSTRQTDRESASDVR